MNEIPLTTILGGGSILLVFGYFFLKDKSFGWINKIFNKGQNRIEERIKNIEIKQEEKIKEIKKKDEEIEEIKNKAKGVIKKAKKEIDDVGNLDNAKELLEELDKW